MPLFRFKKAFFLFSVAVFFLFSFPHGNAQFVWVPAEGDEFVVNVRTNEGFLVRPSTGEMMQFPVITGQKRVLHYLGLHYFGETPVGMWEARSKHTKSDRITYGRDGLFLRLYLDGQETHYGIHAHRDEDVMFKLEDRNQSMGCIIVPTNMLDIIEETFDLNGGKLAVTTFS